jgi:hypothetical protein
MPTLVAALLAFQTALTEGPALRLRAVEGQRPHSVELDEDTWAHGFYRVTFTYRLSTPVSQLIAQCREERSITSQSAWHGDSSFSMTRMHGGVSQRVAVNKRVAKSDVSAETETGAYASVVTVTETAIEDVAPLAFYVGARRPPPVPMIEVPFAPGVLAHSVSLVGFDDLFSGKGAFSYQQRAKDASVYRASVSGEVATFEAWARANGYEKTTVGSWFRAGSGVFEVSVHEAAKGRLSVTLSSSRRRAVRPIVWTKI